MTAFLSFWGKAGGVRDGEPSWHPLPYHSLDVAAVADELLAHSPRKLASFARLLGTSPENARAFIVRLVALHDVGKFTVAFQAKSLEAWEAKNGVGEVLGAYNVPNAPGQHDRDGFLLGDRLDIRAAFAPALDDWSSSDFHDLWAAITGHHGKPANLGGGAHVAISSACERAVRAFVAATAEITGSVDRIALPEPESLAAASWLVAGLTVVADWIGSNRGWFPYSPPSDDLARYWKEARQQARVAVVEAGLLPRPLPDDPGPRRLLPEITDRLSPLQQEVCALRLPDGPTLTIIEEVTGSGKTEAALLLAARLMAAGRADGLFFALPTMATANAIYERLAGAYERLYADSARPSLVLAHGRRALNAKFTDTILPVVGNDDGSGDGGGAACAAWIADDRRKAFLAHVGVGTIDQALLGVLPSRHQVIRLWGLADRVLIIDEAHSFDQYMSRELETLLEFQAALGGSVIVLSATLTGRQRHSLATAFAKGLCGKPAANAVADYPLMTMVSAGDVIATPLVTRTDRTRRLPVRRIETAAEAVEQIKRMASEGCAVAWIRNTVDDAMAGLAALEATGCVSSLLHARFAMGDRLDIEATVKDTLGRKDKTGRRTGFVVVGSQILEQSLDYDVDVMITDLAPIDLVIQRAGRLWRHTDRKGRPIETPELLVLSPDPAPDKVVDRDWYRQLSPGAAAVYGHHGIVWRSARELFREGAIDTPGGVRGLIEAVYGRDRDDLDDLPEPLRRASAESVGKDSASRAFAGANLLKVGKGYGGETQIWSSDVITATRLGLPQTVFRLGHFVDGSVAPWRPNDDIGRAWALSEVSIGKTKAIGVPDGGRHDRAIAAAKLAWPKWERDLPLLLLEPADTAGAWRGLVTAPDGTTKVVAYDRRIGLRLV